MKKSAILLTVILACLTACDKASSPAPASGAASSKVPDAVQQKLRQYAGAGATDCGRLEVHADAAQSKAASDCALQASQGKRPFLVGYDMPGMIIGVAGNAEGKLFTVQSQEGAAVTSGDCPSQLRVASSGRVTCFAPGDMGSMSGSHAAGAVAPGMANPHSSGTENPHTAPPKKN